MASRSSDRGPIAVEIEVQVSPTLTDPIPTDRLVAAARAALLMEDAAGEISLVVTDDRAIQALSRDFLGKDAPTDVLAFGAQEEAAGFVSAPEAGDYLGDVIISYPRAKTQAQEAGHMVEQELDLLVVHGVLHLLGYDHADESEEAIMWARQGEILRSL